MCLLPVNNHKNVRVLHGALTRLFFNPVSRVPHNFLRWLKAQIPAFLSWDRRCKLIMIRIATSGPSFTFNASCCVQIDGRCGDTWQLVQVTFGLARPSDKRARLFCCGEDSGRSRFPLPPISAERPGRRGASGRGVEAGRGQKTQRASNFSPMPQMSTENHWI